MQEQMSDAALWISPRALQEKQTVLRRLAQAQEATMPYVARDALREDDTIADLRKVILRPTKSTPGI